MASLGGTYDATQGEHMSIRSALPAGEYLAAIARSDVSDTRKGDGRKVELEFGRSLAQPAGRGCGRGPGTAGSVGGWAGA
jgi:hypothetical protein